MRFTAQQIAGLINGKVEGNPHVTVNGLAKIEEGKPQTLSFLANVQYAHHLYTTDASIVIIADNFLLENAIKETCTLIRVADPRQSFAILLDSYNQMKNAKVGISEKAIIATSAKIGTNVYIDVNVTVSDNVTIGNNVKIYANTFIGEGTKIGDNTIIYSGVNIYHDTRIGTNCILQSGAVIGGDGFGFQPNSENNYNKIPHIGNVVLEDHVEIGANTTIDRATLGSTIIRKGVKLDNLIQIGHNVEIGENTVIAAQTGVAGSTKIGKNCMIGGQVGIVGHLVIEDNVKIAAQSGISNSLKADSIVQGSPGFNIGDYKRSYVMFRKLPEMQQQINDLQKIIAELKKDK